MKKFISKLLILGFLFSFGFAERGITTLPAGLLISGSGNLRVSGNATIDGTITASGDTTLTVLTLGTATATCSEADKTTTHNSNIAYSAGYMSVDTYNNAATSNLYTITGGATGNILVLHSLLASQDVTVMDDVSSGNIEIAGDFALSDPSDSITLIYTGSVWALVSSANVK